MFAPIIEKIENNLFILIILAAAGLFFALKKFKQDKNNILQNRGNLIFFIIVMILGVLTLISFISELIFSNWYLANLSNLPPKASEYGVLIFEVTRFLAIFTAIFALIFTQIKKKHR